MSEKPTYPIGGEIIPKYEQELIDSLPDLYKDEPDNIPFVQVVYISNFRSKLREVMGDFLEERAKGRYGVDKAVPLSEYEIPDLCTVIDETIENNRELLGLLDDGANDEFKLAFGKVQELRLKVGEDLEELAMQAYKDAFAEHGIVDRVSLLAKGITWFLKTKGLEFPPFGSSKAFLKHILGEFKGEIKTECLEQVADKLWPLTEVERIQSYKDAFSEQGILDRASLLDKGSTWFNETKGLKFPPFGGSKAFFKTVLGQFEGRIAPEHLEQVADKLWPLTEVERIQSYKDALAEHGIVDRGSLLAKTVFWFTAKRLEFPPFGGFQSFFKTILGQFEGKIAPEHLEQVADKLWPLTEVERIQSYKDALAEHGIVDRSSLLGKKAAWFNTTKGLEFPPFGGSKAFFKTVLGQFEGNITPEHLEQVADKLGWHEVELSLEEKYQHIQSYKDAFAEHGIVDRVSLLTKGAYWFQTVGLKFPPFGGSTAFFKTILGQFEGKIKKEHLEQVADKLGWHEVELSLEEKYQQVQSYKDAFAEHGIVDRASLLAKKAMWFIRTKGLKFPPFGGAIAFFTTIIGEPGYVTKKRLNQVADIVFPEETEQQS